MDRKPDEFASFAEERRMERTIRTMSDEGLGSMARTCHDRPAIMRLIAVEFDRRRAFAEISLDSSALIW